MPIDLSQSRLAIESREEGREQGLEEGIKQGLEEGREQGLEEGIKLGLDQGRRDSLRRVTATRFGDDALAARAASVPAELLDEVIDLVATAGVAQLTGWLASHDA